MDKNFLQDVVPPAQKKSIKNIPLPKKKSFSENGSAIKINKVGPKGRTPNPPIKTKRIIPPPPIQRRKEQIVDFEERGGNKIMKKLIIGSGLVAVALVFVLIFLGMSKTEVNIYPKEAHANIETTLLASSTEDEESDLTYKPIEIKSTKEALAKAGDEQKVETKASGKIIVFNKHSKEAYPLIKNTRFQSESGLIYRVDHSIEIPGYKEEGGKIIPGELEVEVFADSVGEEYNINETTFTIPGFKGLKQYDNFYATSKTKMSGGFSGIKKAVSEEDKDSAIKEIQNSLREELVAKLDSEAKDGVIIHYDDTSFTYEVVGENPDGDNVKLNIEAKLEAYVFDLNKVAKALALKNLGNVDEKEEMTIENYQEMKFDTFKTEDSIELKITGNAHFVWTFDVERLKEELLNKERKDMKQILENFPSIVRAEATIKPVWKNSFPSTKDKINVNIIYEKID